jgi:hypothetical protein
MGLFRVLVPLEKETKCLFKRRTRRVKTDSVCLRWGVSARRIAMSYLVAAPEFLASAATDLSNVGSAL